MPPIDLAFGVCILSFLHKAIVQITIPQTVKRVPANIKILGISVPLIQNAWYPIFIQGNSEPQSAITRRDKTMVLSLDSLLFIPASLMVFTILHQLERVIVQSLSICFCVTPKALKHERLVGKHRVISLAVISLSTVCIVFLIT